MRRMIIQRDFVNDQDVAIESLNENVSIGDYSVSRIGNIIFVDATIVLDTNVSANNNLLKISGVPQSKIDLYDYFILSDTASLRGRLINTSEGVKFTAASQGNAGTYFLSMFYQC